MVSEIVKSGSSWLYQRSIRKEFSQKTISKEANQISSNENPFSILGLNNNKESKLTSQTEGTLGEILEFPGTNSDLRQTLYPIICSEERPLLHNRLKELGTVES